MKKFLSVLISPKSVLIGIIALAMIFTFAPAKAKAITLNDLNNLVNQVKSLTEEISSLKSLLGAQVASYSADLTADTTTAVVAPTSVQTLTGTKQIAIDPSPLYSVVLKVNGSGTPSSVNYKDVFKASWIATPGADRCVSFGHWIPNAKLTGLWNDNLQLPDSGFRSLTAALAYDADLSQLQHNNLLEIGLQCWWGNKSATDKVYLSVTAPSTPIVSVAEVAPTAPTLATAPAVGADERYLFMEGIAYKITPRRLTSFPAPDARTQFWTLIDGVWNLTPKVSGLFSLKPDDTYSTRATVDFSIGFSGGANVQWWDEIGRKWVLLSPTLVGVTPTPTVTAITPTILPTPSGKVIVYEIVPTDTYKTVLSSATGVNFADLADFVIMNGSNKNIRLSSFNLVNLSPNNVENFSNIYLSARKKNGGFSSALIASSYNSAANVYFLTNISSTLGIIPPGQSIIFRVWATTVKNLSNIGKPEAVSIFANGFTAVDISVGTGTKPFAIPIETKVVRKFIINTIKGEI